MRVRRLRITNFRGIRDGEVDFPGHTLLVGGNNTGKSTICEALDLVLGPERLFRRPVVDEHDFFRGRYRITATEPPTSEKAEGLPNDPGELPQDATGGDRSGDAHDATEGVIRIEAVLVDLSDEAQRRFRGHMRRWNETESKFVDDTESPAPELADAVGTTWALPVVFLGRYNQHEDEFEGGTFFLHPRREVDEEDIARLGAGFASFSREDKRLCGFVFLRALRTGSRALTLQKGSLLDTILRLAGNDAPEMWVNTLDKLQGMQPPIGDIPHLKMIQQQIQRRTREFIGLAPDERSTSFFASELTREHLREVVRLFVASAESEHLLPFQRHGTGTINVLVFALLTFIAELKSKRSVIFAMEEPEIALPPHTQRRIVRFVLREMGQTVVTSHSPYVIEQFNSGDIVVLHREAEGRLSGRALEAGGVTERLLRTQRRQFAEAVLGRAILVVEGGTEVSLCHTVSSALEGFLPSSTYLHIDLAGVTLFNAGSDREVPRFGPIFQSMNKPAFALHDRQKTPWSPDQESDLATYESVHEHGYYGVEDLLVAEVPASVHRIFLEQAAARADYPQVKKYDVTMTDEEVLRVSKEVLVARKGEGYAYGPLLISSCRSLTELPPSFVDLLQRIDQHLQSENTLSQASMMEEVDISEAIATEESPE